MSNDLVGQPEAPNEEESKIIINEQALQPNEQQELNLKKPVRKWEKRWVLQPNVIELGCEIWI